MEKIIEYLMPLIRNLATALIVSGIGLLTIKKIKNLIEKKFKKNKIDNILKPFLLSLIVVGLHIILIIIIIGILGIDTSSFIAILASAGFAIGLAFQGSLSNFAGGVLLLSVKPFNIGDYIEVNSEEGSVKAIKLLYTELLTIDNKIIFIPNGVLANSNITNFTRNKTRMLNLKFSVSYSASHKKVIKAITKVVENHELAHKDPQPIIRMLEHGDNALIYRLRVWCNTEDYWSLYYDLIENIKEEFDNQNISIPLPQMDIHINNK